MGLYIEIAWIVLAVLALVLFNPATLARCYYEEKFKYLVRMTKLPHSGESVQKGARHDKFN